MTGGLSPVLAADRWRSNAELIVDCVRLGHLNEDDHVLDPTYGRGVWWKLWRPEKLTAFCRERDGSDFRSLPHLDESFDAVAFDPPYVSIGGRNPSKLTDSMHSRYGMAGTPRSPAELQRLIDDGLAEMVRLVRPRGRILVKCQSYVSGGKLWRGTVKTEKAAEALGLETIDELVHITNPRPQPVRTRQVHARRNCSTLFVFRK